MKKKPITKQNTFKRHAVSSEGKLIVLDATKDVTEKDLAQINYRKLQSTQFDPVTEFETRSIISACLLSLSILVLFFTFVYLIIKHIA